VRHFHEKLREAHEIRYSYTWVKTALQEAGSVGKRKKRGSHRKRRPRRPLPGMMLHIDASEHRWFAGDRKYELLVEAECTRSVMIGLRELIQTERVFCSMYSDRAGHFLLTRKHGDRVDPSRLTQVGRALQELGVKMIAAFSPQARGRSERFFGTWQGRLPQELRSRGITDVEEANEFLRRKYIADSIARFAAAQKGTAFVRLRRKETGLHLQRPARASGGQ
jgi:hypothetical protein